MKINQSTVLSISSSPSSSSSSHPITSLLLTPYTSHHVPTYHSWMQSPALLTLTASEPLSVDEEYAMQRKWREDGDKLTFIICLVGGKGKGKGEGKGKDVEEMIGDVNCFISPSTTTPDEEEEEEVLEFEFEIMIASPSHRRHGHGRGALIAFLHYITRPEHLSCILDEYQAYISTQNQSQSQPQTPSKTPSQTQSQAQTQSEFQTQDQKKVKAKVVFLAKINQENKSSIRLFESLGFVKESEKADYFGEVRLLGPAVGESEGKDEGNGEGEREGWTEGLMRRFGVEGWEERRVDCEDVDVDVD